ncbi:histidinol-phosphatase HisJ family protein [candidate division KSB1 bacterium]|nr:histidinol-phosphatase HisJ family protein [candidate division KSB1 bacterium]
MLGDFHVHSYLCKHGKGTVEEYVIDAIEKGLKYIGFSEHIPVPGLDDPDGRMELKDFSTYINDIRNARETYHKDISILLAIEADYLPGYMDFISAFVNDHPFDYVIGSVHFLGDWDYSNPALMHRYDEFGVDLTFQRNYELLALAAQTGLYQVIGHLDQPKKYGHRAMRNMDSLIQDTLKIIRDNSCALDVNTSGWRKPVAELYPSLEILKMAKELQVPIMLGSDAHQPGDVAADFDRGMELLKEIGFKDQTYFIGKEPHLAPL